MAMVVSPLYSYVGRLRDNNDTSYHQALLVVMYPSESMVHVYLLCIFRKPVHLLVLYNL